MKKNLLFKSAALAISTALAAPALSGVEVLTIPDSGRGNAKVAHLGKSIDQMIYEFMEEEQIPGLTLAIVQAPYIPRVAGYGVADAETGKLASTKTIWAAGPLSQAYNAVAILQLVEAGKVQLDAPISTYLKELPEQWRNITVYQLLQHASGIADYRQAAGYSAAREYQPAELFALAAGTPVAFTPGTDVALSATNFLLLAEIVEAASGQSYHDFVTKHQFERLGLRNTIFLEDLPKLANEKLTPALNKHRLFLQDPSYIDPAEPAAGSRAGANGLQAVAALRSGQYKGFGDIWATAEEISRWDIGLAGGILIEKPEHRALVYQPTRLANGNVVPALAGWQFQHHKGLMDIQGSVPGHSAYLSRFTAPDELVCVTLMCNKEGVDFTNLARRIASAFGTPLSSGVNDNELYVRESVFGVPETVARLESALAARRIPVFGKVDHAANARGAGLQQEPSVVLTFGVPKTGTPLMQKYPAMALELPLKIAVWQDAGGSVWASFTRMDRLAERYGIANEPVIAAMQKLLESLVREATTVYATHPQPRQPLLLDVRTAEEFADGHLPDAVLMPVETVSTAIAATAPDHAQEIQVYCRRGIRAEQAKEALIKLGYTNVTNLGSLQEAAEKLKQPVVR